jgi:hypothetical protein
VEEATASHLTSQITERYQELKIELPTPLHLDLLVHSAVQTIEGQFFNKLSQALTLETRQMIDAMLTDSPNTLSLTSLKADSGRRTLNSLEMEIEKLRQLKSLALPDDILTPLSSRFLQRIKLRVSAETLHELRRHPDPIRYALVADAAHLSRCRRSRTLRAAAQTGASRERSGSQPTQPGPYGASKERPSTWS